MDILRDTLDGSYTTPAVGRTALELLAKPIADIVDGITVDGDALTTDKQPRASRTNKRTYDPRTNSFDHVTDIERES